MSERAELRQVVMREVDYYPQETQPEVANAVLRAIVCRLGITQEMVEAVRHLSVHRYTYQGVPRERIDPVVAAAADILQALLDAGGDDE